MRNFSQWVCFINSAVCVATLLVGCGLISVSDPLDTPVRVQRPRSRNPRGDRRARFGVSGSEPAETCCGVPGASL
jgi:hypothetical protein